MQGHAAYPMRMAAHVAWFVSGPAHCHALRHHGLPQVLDLVRLQQVAASELMAGAAC
jgi:hypothetical protein